MKTEHAKAAKSIKAELMKAYPGITFSVKSKSFSMGDDVRVTWTDGPTLTAVEQIIDKYQYGHFDGMNDIYEYHRDREPTAGRAKYVFANRHIDPTGYTAMIKDLCLLNRVEYQAEEWRITLGKEWHETACHIVNKIMAGTPVPAGYSIRGLERTDCICGSIEDFYRVKMERKP